MNANTKKIVIYVLSGLLSILFLLSGVMKFFSAEAVQQFEGFGYPGWLTYLIGGIEIVAVILLWVPGTRKAGASLIILLMLGAIYSHFSHQDAFSMMGPSISALLAAVVLMMIEGREPIANSQ